MSETILLVDDDAGVRDVVAFTLRREGFDVDEAIANTRPHEPGWGLTIIRALSDDWGVERNGGTCVWATVLPRSDHPGLG